MCNQSLHSLGNSCNCSCFRYNCSCIKTLIGAEKRPIDCTLCNPTFETMKNPIKPISKDIKPIQPRPNDFVQVTRGYINDLSTLAGRSLPAFRVFTFLLERMTRQNAVVVSQNTLAEILNYNKSTISRAVKVLRTENWVQVVSIGSSFGYLVNNRVAWRDHSDKKIGFFSAEVVVSASEQKESIEALESQPLRRIPNVKQGETAISAGDSLTPPDQQDMFENEKLDHAPLLYEDNED